MKTYLKRAFQLSDSGVKGLAKSIWSFFLYYVSFVPPMICVFLFADRLLNGNTGKPVVYLLFMLAATLVMYLVINYNYKTTYDETYQESANLRIDLAEQLSKLPLSYFSKHNLSDLAQTIMADVASIEHTGGTNAYDHSSGSICTPHLWACNEMGCGISHRLWVFDRAETSSTAPTPAAACLA